MVHLNEAEVELVSRAHGRAQEMVAEAYALPGFGPDRYLHEVATLRDQAPEEQRPDVLAHLVRYVRTAPGPGFERRPSHYYRICLQDDAILRCVHTNRFQLWDLLLVVLTHELVHVVRFERFCRLMDVPETIREAEEGVVCAETERILRPRADPGLQAVLEHLAGPARLETFKNVG